MNTHFLKITLCVTPNTFHASVLMKDPIYEDIL